MLLQRLKSLHISYDSYNREGKMFLVKREKYMDRFVCYLYIIHPRLMEGFILSGKAEKPHVLSFQGACDSKDREEGARSVGHLCRRIFFLRG